MKKATRRKGPQMKDVSGKEKGPVADGFTVSLDEQVAFFDAHIDEVDLVAILQDVQEDAKRLARERLVEFAPVYGDGNFHKPVAALRQEQVEEASDAVNYQMFILYRKANGLD